MSRPRPGRLLIILPVVLLLVAALAGGGLFLLGPKLGVGPFAAHAAEATPVPVEKPSRGIMYETKERVINLTDPGGPRYIKVQVVLEFLDEEGKPTGDLKGEAYKKAQTELAKDLGPLTVVIDDVIIRYFSGQAAAGLISPEGKERVKSDLLTRFSEALETKRIAGVYLTQFVIQ